MKSCSHDNNKSSINIQRYSNTAQFPQNTHLREFGANMRDMAKSRPLSEGLMLVGAIAAVKSFTVQKNRADRRAFSKATLHAIPSIAAKHEEQFSFTISEFSRANRFLFLLAIAFNRRCA